MPCPRHSPAALSRLSRRDVVKAALAVGGGSALSACVEREEVPDVPRGPADLSTHPTRQFAWNDYLPRDDHGDVALPEHQLVVFFEYAPAGVPTEAERERVEAAFRGLERAFQRGIGDVSPNRYDGQVAPGLLLTVGYAPSYFDRFDDDLPVPLPRPEATLERIDESTGKATPHEVVVVMVSEYAQVLLQAEEALLGNLDVVNGVEIPASVEGVLERVERRTGFVGFRAVPRELDHEGLPENAPLSMGFKSNFSDGQASEDRVAIERGPFAGGTTQHVSRLLVDLDGWYDRDDDERRHLMFTPHHSEEDVGETGRRLGASSGLTPQHVERLADDADEHGMVGHAQKVAAARDEDFAPTILRRSEGVSTDTDDVGFNFTSLQRRIERFVEVRQAMNESLDVPEENDGIREFLTVESRGNFLVPPRELRSLPPAHPE